MCSGDTLLCQKFHWIFSMPHKEGFTNFESYSIPNPSFGLAWDLGFRPGLRDSELEEISSFTLYLSNFFINHTNHDSCIWSLSPEGFYDSRSFHIASLSQWPNSTSQGSPTQIFDSTRIAQEWSLLGSHWGQLRESCYFLFLFL